MTWNFRSPAEAVSLPSTCPVQPDHRHRVLLHTPRGGDPGVPFPGRSATPWISPRTIGALARRGNGDAASCWEIIHARWSALTHYSRHGALLEHSYYRMWATGCGASLVLSADTALN